MKIFLIFLSSLLFSCTLSYAQPYKTIKVFKPYHWMIGVSWSAIDDDGRKLEGMFDVGPSWNILMYPSRISVDRYFKYGWSIEGVATYNEYLPIKCVNDTVGLSSIFFSFDVNGKYSFYNRYAPRMRWFDPYFTFGVGYTFRSSAAVAPHVPTLNLGFGINFWFLKNFGVQLHSNGKLGLFPGFWDTHSSYLQHSAGLVFRFKTSKKKKSDFGRRKNKWAHGNSRYKNKKGH